MARQQRNHGAGSIELRNGHYWVRVSYPDGSRPRLRLCKLVCDCHQMSEAKRLDRAAHVSERAREEVRARMTAEKQAAQERRLTVRQFGEKWTSGKLYEQHGDVNGLKLKASATNDAQRFNAYVYDVIGDKAVADVTEQDIETVLAKAEAKARKKLGHPWRKGSRFQLYQLLRRMFDLAIRPGRLREDNPVPKWMRPGKDAPKLYGYLYPSELLQLLAKTEVPIERRVLYALATYTGLRKGSLLALKWGGVDFHHRTLTSLQSKTGLPQVFEIHESLLELLKAWHRHQGKPSKKSPIVTLPPTRQREAAVLRADLVTAQVTREALKGEESNVQAMRFHDLRATFVTWAKREGRGDGWISDRTGHLTAEMLNRYTRAARTLADLGYEPFPDIAKAIPELAELPENVVPLGRRGATP